MRFGVAKDIITPDILTHMAGYTTRYDMYFKGIHDDLYVKSLLIDNETRRIILIAVDLLFHDYELTKKVKIYIHTKYDMPEENVFLSYTHTHAGPAVEGYDAGQSSDYYEDFLLTRIISCVDRAFINSFEGQAAFGIVEGDWNINRRMPVNGQMQMLPNPEGLKDDEINIVKICDNEGNIKIVLLTYACHPVTLRDTIQLSAEYPGRFCQLLEAEYYGAVAIFFQGAGGNARPKITQKGNGFKKCSFNEVNDMALAMANNVKRCIYESRLAPLIPMLAARQFAIPLDIEVYPKSHFEEIMLYDMSIPSLQNAARNILERYDSSGDSVNLHAGIIRLAKDVFILFMGGEVCYEIKLNLEKLFIGAKLIFIAYGDSTAYIPDDKIIAEGGYEAEDSAIEFELKGKFKSGINKRIESYFVENMKLLTTSKLKSL